MYKKIEIQTLSFIAILVLALAALASTVSAAQLTSGSLLLSDPRPGQTGVTYTFSAANFSTATAIECVDFVFSINSDGSGGAAGTTTGATLDSSTAIGTNWTLDATTNGTVNLLANPTAATPASSGDVVFSGMTNPSEGTYYLNVTTYSDAGCSTVIDSSRIAYATKAGEPVSLTIDPTLTFTCTPVGSGISVNGINTTIASTASGIDFGNTVNPTTNGISAHDIGVSTNAANGYTVSIRQSGPFSNGSYTIPAWTGTNASPTSPIPSTLTEAWGYTTEDSALSTAAVDRFTNGGPNWAGFNTSNEEVMYNDGSVQPITDTVRIGHQVAIDTTTPAGTYQTTIIYTVASVY